MLQNVRGFLFQYIHNFRRHIVKSACVADIRRYTMYYEYGVISFKINVDLSSFSFSFFALCTFHGSSKFSVNKARFLTGSFLPNSLSTNRCIEYIWNILAFNFIHQLSSLHIYRNITYPIFHFTIQLIRSFNIPSIILFSWAISPINHPYPPLFYQSAHSTIPSIRSF